MNNTSQNEKKSPTIIPMSIYVFVLFFVGILFLFIVVPFQKKRVQEINHSKYNQLVVIFNKKIPHINHKIQNDFIDGKITLDEFISTLEAYENFLDNEQTRKSSPAEIAQFKSLLSSQN